MTTPYNPRPEWTREDKITFAGTPALLPAFGPVPTGGRCNIIVSGFGQARRYCHAPATRIARDADGRQRPLCASCVGDYFPCPNTR